MIILFEENETEFKNLGLGVLKDAYNCTVKEELNGAFELSMNYPVDGKNFNDLKINRIIYCKANPYGDAQPFRIYSITKPIKGIVTVEAVHISYDMNGIPVKAIDGENLNDALTKLEKNALIEHKFKFSSDILSGKTYKTTAPYNMRAILMGGEESVVEKYNAELSFDKFKVNISEKRGRNRGAEVVYANNMTDLNHVSSNENLYNGIFPYYHSERTSNETTTEEKFTQVYIVGSKPLQDGWLSYTKDGEPYHPIEETPVQIASEGEFYEDVYSWSNVNQKYIKKIYNETITVIEGVMEPIWIKIDWSKFPTIAIKANRAGYFKKSTDTSWGDYRGVGDTIFEGSLIKGGLMENLVLSYAEVIPSSANSVKKEVNEIVEVILDDPIIWVNAPESKAMLFNKILSVDLTSEFDEEPTQERLRAKAEEYINKNKIGRIKHTTEVSFLDLHSTTESDKYRNFNHIELGDEVSVKYVDIGVDVNLRVLTTEYDVNNDIYTSVSLGEKQEKISSSTIQNGDNISSLTNDAGYTDVTTVNKLIAKTVTADYLQASDAKLSQAQIEQLAVERINCTGIFEASQFTLDKLVATMLIAENAEIAQTLTAGNIKVAGDISVNSGQINISGDDGTVFLVDRLGNLSANSVNITGGTLNINDGVFNVTNQGVLTATGAIISGNLTATSGSIAGFKIISNRLYTGTLGLSGSVMISGGGTTESASIGGSDNINGWVIASGGNFGVTKSGAMYCKSGKIGGFYINTNNICSPSNFDLYNTDIENGVYIGTNGIKLGQNFKVDSGGNIDAMSLDVSSGDSSVKIQNGKITATNAKISGELTAGSGKIARFNINDTSLYTDNYDAFKKDYYQGLYIGNDGISLGKHFSVTNEGNLEASNVTITGGSLDINNKFKVNTNGEFTATSATITGGSLNINDGVFKVNTDGSVESSSITISGGSLNINNVFKVNSSGHVDASSVCITGGELTIGGKYSVSTTGVLTATDVDLTGKITATTGKIGPLNVTSSSLSFSSTSGTSMLTINGNAKPFVPIEGNNPTPSITGNSAKFSDLLLGSSGEYYTYFDYTKGLKVNRVSQGTGGDDLGFVSQILPQDISKIPTVIGVTLPESSSDFSAVDTRSIKMVPLTLTAGTSGYELDLNRSTYGYISTIVHAIATCKNNAVAVAVSWNGSKITVKSASGNQTIEVLVIGY